ncbi:3-phosphoglycerate dehydrogenase [Sulfodiicoccus acidiphilus]|uniref:3-phosphoglycerate dehydrogenase n=1 Tax=Sulfodiicoccus acidiphilus TaxID=1670455 RepID=A0A348B3I3_9CREN|nr:D-2-hydroxyacid dehydrogenase [Sulfodiicoccus acidiphilus]BBD72735.1 3-phosphoglycerate dehydrogenase [Sulfodiicoccus acidiphilus]GGT95199.1 3-phosphoglycerate dehydrogenase [Sulfodiicoccus acidiphilus]
MLSNAERTISNQGQHKVLITDPVDQLLLKILEDGGVSVDYRPDLTREKLLSIVGDYDAVVVRSRTKIDKEVLKGAGKLKVIARAGIGLDTIDVEEAERRKIRVVYAPGASTDSVVELTLGLMVSAARRLEEAFQRTRAGKFEKITGTELHGKVLGVVGFGRIGSKVASVAKALGMKTLAYDTIDVGKVAAHVGAEVVSLQELLKQSDVISIHVGMKRGDPAVLGRMELDQVKEGVLIVNTSRAQAIDGEALLQALKTGKVGFYATDVLWNEPPRTKWEIELLNHPRVSVTPHIGAQTVEAQRRIAEATAVALLKELRSEEN